VAKESHAQNLDILKHMERMEKQLEMLRKQEKETQGQMNNLQQRLKEKETRIITIEDQLNWERAKLANMVPREDFEAANQEARLAEQKLLDLEESFQVKQRDYMSIVEAYTKVTGQELEHSAASDARPLTPRPTWFHCRGLIDPELHHTYEKSEVSQELLQHMLVCSRTLIAAYGLSAAASKSELYRETSKHTLAVPLALTAADGVLHNRSLLMSAPGEDEDPMTLGETKRDKARTAALMKEGEDMLPPDLDPETPQEFQHAEPVKNLRFSRKKVIDFLEGLVSARLRSGNGYHSTPFLKYLVEHVPEDVPEEEKKLFAINVYATLRRYHAEPDFMGFLNLVLGAVSETVLRDNKRITSELLRIFTNHFESGDGSKTITKQKFFYGLREVLPNKEKDAYRT